MPTVHPPRHPLTPPGGQKSVLCHSRQRLTCSLALGSKGRQHAALPRAPPRAAGAPPPTPVPVSPL